MTDNHKPLIIPVALVLLAAAIFAVTHDRAPRSASLALAPNLDTVKAI